MYPANVYRDTYLEDRVLSASPMELVRMLYEGAIESVGQARQSLLAGDIGGRARAISKAQAIVGELAQSLQPGSPELERNLRRLYDYVLSQLLEANAMQTEGPLVDAERVLTVLLDAWQTVEPAPLPARSAAAGQLAVQG